MFSLLLDPPYWFSVQARHLSCDPRFQPFLPRNAIFMHDIKVDMSALEETKATHNYLDNAIVPAEIGTLTKLLRAKKAPTLKRFAMK